MSRRKELDVRFNSIGHFIGAAAAISAIACGAGKSSAPKSGSVEIISDGFAGTALDVSKWTIITGPTLISLDASKGSPAPSLLFQGGMMQATQTINSDAGYTLSFDMAHTAGAGGAWVWARRGQAGTPVNHDFTAQFSFFAGTTPSVVFVCNGGSSTAVPFTDDVVFHHFVLTVTAAGMCTWKRDGVVHYSTPVATGLGLYNLVIYSGNSTAGMQYHIDNVVVTSP